jgi:hypothetical protein
LLPLVLAELTYVGRVKWGVGRRVVEGILTRCTTRATPACPDAERWGRVVWVEPRVGVEVSYSELMVGRLRDPVLRGLFLAAADRRALRCATP